MIVNWDFYVRRKRLNVKEWLERKNIKDYNSLAEVTKKLGIETPQKEKVSKYFENLEIKKNDKQTKKPVTTPNTSSEKIRKVTKKSSTSRTKSAKSEKQKTTKPRRTTRKRKTTTKVDK